MRAEHGLAGASGDSMQAGRAGPERPGGQCQSGFRSPDALRGHLPDTPLWPWARHRFPRAILSPWRDYG